MTPTVPSPDPLGLPVPVSLLLTLKVAGFFLHLIFMNLWVAGLPTALALWKFRPTLSKRLFRMIPFFLAFGINAGIVPLLFLQTLYPQFFYPATILQAWFWFMIIPLLLIAYYSAYLASYERFPVLTGGVAFVLLTWIGLTFSASMSLTAAPARWPDIFIATAYAGAVHGAYLNLSLETFLRYGLVFGMALGTVAAFLALDTEWFTKDPDYQVQTRPVIPILYALGLVVYGIAGMLYVPMVMDKVPRVIGVVAGGSMPVAAILAVVYRKWPGKRAGLALIAAQLLVLLSNAIARQMVQTHKLHQWVDLHKVPVRGEWGSFALFVVTFAIAIVVLAWIGLTVFRRTHLSESPVRNEGERR